MPGAEAGEVTLAAVDVLIVVKYDFTDHANTCIYTNARTEALDELLVNCLQDEVYKFLGRDPAEPNMGLDVYTIKVGYFLDDDCFSIESDTNNRGFTVGILSAVLGTLSDIAVKPLSELT